MAGKCEKAEESRLLSRNTCKYDEEDIQNMSCPFCLMTLGSSSARHCLFQISLDMEQVSIGDVGVLSSDRQVEAQRTEHSQFVDDPEPDVYIRSDK